MPAPLIDLEALTFVGENLNRPECVLTTANGALFVSDWSGQGGVSRLSPNGGRAFIEVLHGPKDFTVRPNGIALLVDGSFLLAHLGDTGGVYRLTRDGHLTPWLTEVDGQALPPTNFVTTDPSGRCWVTVSTRKEPRALAYNPAVSDGFIVMADADGARIVADGIGYTNEAIPHPSGRWLYVNETIARRLSRLEIRGNGDLGRRETVTEFGPGTFPDGLAFDAEGGAWIVAVVSNRVIRVMPDGTQQLIVEDCDPDHVDWVEAAFQAGEMGRPHLDTIKSKVLRNISSIAFGGADRKTCYLGCLLGDRLTCFESPVAGAEPVQWNS